MTIKPVVKSMLDMDTEGDWITFHEKEELAAEFEELTINVCKAAAADVENDLDRVGALKVATISPLMTNFYLLLASVDFFSYVYKVITFTRSGDYPLAALMTFACVESITTLVYMGHIQEWRRSKARTASSGVPSLHFLALVQWDDGIAGIPALFTSVHGLPLTRPSALSALSTAFFLATGTKALAAYLGDMEDAGMYEVPGDRDAGEEMVEDVQYEALELTNEVSKKISRHSLS